MYGRSDEEWEQLADSGHDFLVDRARRKDMTNYADLNSAIVLETGLRGFDFERADAAGRDRRAALPDCRADP